LSVGASQAIAIAFALLAALVNAGTTILQRVGLLDAPDDSEMKLKLIGFAIRQKAWLAGMALMMAGFLCEFVALWHGGVVLVLPLETAELVFVVIIVSALRHHRLGWHEMVGSIGTAAGLGVFLAVADPTGGQQQPNLLGWIGVGVGTVVALGGCIAIARLRQGPWRAAFYGVAAGIGYGVAATLTKVVTTLAREDWTRLPLHWQTYALVICGVSAAFLAQNAFKIGPVTASQPGQVVGGPLTSVLLGVALFGNSLRTSGARGPVEAIALLVMFVSTFVLSQSPLVVGMGEMGNSAPGSATAQT